VKSFGEAGGLVMSQSITFSVPYHEELGFLKRAQNSVLTQYDSQRELNCDFLQLKATDVGN
jgi:hypothetical protein